MHQFALVNMPFASAQTPSIQMGLLKAILERDGIESRDCYFNVELANAVGYELYNSLCHIRGPLLGEWLFTKAAFPAVPALDEFTTAFEEFTRDFCLFVGCTPEDLRYLREDLIPRFVDHCAAQLQDYRAVGFSSTFQQNVASLAVARRLKALNPTITTIFGGANYEAPMGPAFMAAFEWIDIIVSGEADDTISPLIEAVLEGQAPPPLEGVLTRANLSSTFSERHSLSMNMDALPVPDYTRYFELIARVPGAVANTTYPISVPFETSRGCWWGQKSHCTFCGLNAGGMRYRAKSPKRVGSEIKTLIARHGVHALSAVDNIMPIEHANEMLDEIAASCDELDLFYEVKSNVRPENVRQMAAANIKTVQPGVESLSTTVLRIMRKGVSALQNINALRWFSMYGIFPSWNFLYGFPGEVTATYDEQTARAYKLVHLPPPYGTSRIRLDRYSPNFEVAELRAKFDNLRPEASYRFIYPPEVDLWSTAYFFEGEAAEAFDSDAQERALAAIAHWQRAWGVSGFGNPFSDPNPDRPQLSYERGRRGRGMVTDSRRIGEVIQQHHLTRAECITIETAFLQPVSAAYVEQAGVREGVESSTMRWALSHLEELSIVEYDDGALIALPIASPTLADTIVREQREQSPRLARGPSASSRAVA